jgi:hypothetical protein
MKVYADIRGVTPLNLTSVLDGVSGHLHAPDALYLITYNGTQKGPTNWAQYSVRKENLAPAGIRNVMKNEGGNECKIACNLALHSGRINPAIN